jgi:hypothetical protein
MTPLDAFASLPEALRDSLPKEYQSVVTNCRQRRWGPAMVARGRFCEVVYKILSGYPSNYAPIPAGATNMVDDCTRLAAKFPRSTSTPEASDFIFRAY